MYQFENQPSIFGSLLRREHESGIVSHETDRLNWRKGALGEYEVGAELERLSDEFFIFSDLNTAGLGNFDHIVVGPTSLLSVIVRCSAIEYGSLSQPDSL